MADDDVHGASLRSRRPKGTLPTPDSAKQLMQKSLRRTLAQIPSYYNLKRSSNRCVLRAPGTPLGESARVKSPRDFLWVGRDAHLVASTGQSRADGIPCRSSVIDEVLIAPIYWDYGQQPTKMLFRGFLVRENRTYPTHADARQLIRFLSPSPRKEKINKKALIFQFECSGTEEESPKEEGRQRPPKRVKTFNFRTTLPGRHIRPPQIPTTISIWKKPGANGSIKIEYNIRDNVTMNVNRSSIKV
ncbi:hypothetical protein EVAR_2557_1 [Eumeta japonica]|uniref:Uncharacterized protein n=1 Tax=Eumeta variegata TaxID=151549 RepID=A0A4C1SPA8_EUMVA|nr:hypothetical protein EVAR_2557_1 [Eumeta japonica]